MSAKEETISTRAASPALRQPLLNRIVNFLSSVRFGVTLLCILVVLSMIGMLIIQQNVDGFDAYYASLTPAERTVYGALGFFDIYYSWYFNLLLLILSLNIVLASIEHFPAAWSYIVKPKETATEAWLREQSEFVELPVNARTAEDAERQVTEALSKAGFNPRARDFEQLEYPVDDQGRKIFGEPIKRTSRVIFGERGKINRLGAYFVHVALLTLFLGHFVALQTGFDADVRMIPGDATDQIQMLRFELDKKERFNVGLPFTMTCTDIQQKLIDPRGSIDVSNTLDWRTQLRVDDPDYGTTIADVSMNQPFNYRGYRFFQAQTIPIGNARNITLEVTPISGGDPLRVDIPRLGTAQLPDGTFIEYEEFQPDFVFGAEGKADTRTGDYNNPVAVLGVTPPQGDRIRVFAFGSNVSDDLPVAQPKVGYKWRLTEFEKAPFAHVLSIKYDPYGGAFIAWYFGGIGLMAALAYVFFFSHRRIWAIIERDEDGGPKILLGGHTNRNHAAFEERFAKIAASIEEKDPRDSDTKTENDQ